MTDLLTWLTERGADHDRQIIAHDTHEPNWKVTWHAGSPRRFMAWRGRLTLPREAQTLAHDRPEEHEGRPALRRLVNLPVTEELTAEDKVVLAEAERRDIDFRDSARNCKCVRP